MMKAKKYDFINDYKQWIDGGKGERISAKYTSFRLALWKKGCHRRS